MRLINSLILSAISTSILMAQNLNIENLNTLKYEDAFEKKVQISDNAKMIVVSFEKDTGTLIADFLKTKDSTFLADHRALYVADIHKMPAMVTYMFARPKMQKYNFSVVLYNEDDKLDLMIENKEEHLSILYVDENRNIIETKFVKSKEELEKIFN